MPKQILTVTLEADRKAELDSLAEARGRDRDALIDEALVNWLDLQTWQAREIQAGLADAEAGNFATEAEIDAAYGNG
jgi:predicted transcriptional regulator